MEMVKRIFIPLCCCLVLCYRASAFVTPQRSSRNVILSASTLDDVEAKLWENAKLLKLEIFDLDEGIFGFSTRDSRYGLEVVKCTIPIQGGLGIVLTEMAGDQDGRGLVLVSEVSGNAAKASPPIAVGDVITGVIVPDSNYRERTTGLNYDLTVEAIGRAKEAAEGGKLMLEVNRIVKRAEVVVEVDDGSGQVKEVPALAGENLRKLLQRKGFKLYDYDTRRFDMPFAKGDCAGEGLCGTCLVEVKSGEELLNPKDNAEMMITKGRPLKWRAACRTIIGAENQAGRLRVVTKPQSAFKDELNPGVKSIN